VTFFIGLFWSSIGGETWLEKVHRKLQYAIPDHGTWGDTVNYYDVFVRAEVTISFIFIFDETVRTNFVLKYGLNSK
jgi:hypothetical protein